MSGPTHHDDSPDCGCMDCSEALAEIARALEMSTGQCSPEHMLSRVREVLFALRETERQRDRALARVEVLEEQRREIVRAAGGRVIDG